MLDKIARTTLAGQVADRLTEYITLRQIGPGSALPPAPDLAARFGVSRPVIREGLKVLEGRGLIEVVNGKGAIIAPFDASPLKTYFRRAVRLDHQKIIELMEVRKGLEVEAAALAAARAQEEDIVALERVLDEMRAALPRIERFTQHDADFHLLIASATRNSMIRFLVESLRDSLVDSIRAGLQRRRTEAELRQVQRLHEGIVGCIRARDPERAAAAMAKHFDEAVMILVERQPTPK